MEKDMRKVEERYVPTGKEVLFIEAIILLLAFVMVGLRLS